MWTVFSFSLFFCLSLSLSLSPSVCASLFLSYNPSHLYYVYGVRRLDTTRDHHAGLPSPNTRCQLHWWCGPVGDKMRWRQNLLYCCTCNVTLCLECNRLFHSEEFIAKEKLEIEKKLKKTYNKDRRSRNRNHNDTRKTKTKHKNRTHAGSPK
mmetsp:Transcript_25321/g.27162  ORF Transcript_25321/g.27162 Transcript_25321/m.27162 type:complete len:152 (+) Transcript_25321:120-575(+)